jgi:hypothetical protein
MSEKYPNSQKKENNEKPEDTSTAIPSDSREADQENVREILFSEGGNANSKQEWAREAAEVTQGSQEHQKQIKNSSYPSTKKKKKQSKK